MVAAKIQAAAGNLVLTGTPIASLVMAGSLISDPRPLIQRKPDSVVPEVLALP